MGMATLLVVMVVPPVPVWQQEQFCILDNRSASYKGEIAYESRDTVCYQTVFGHECIRIRQYAQLTDGHWVTSDHLAYLTVSEKNGKIKACQR